MCVERIISLGYKEQWLSEMYIIRSYNINLLTFFNNYKNYCPSIIINIRLNIT